MPGLRIVGLGGSLSRRSTSREALRVALEGASKQGAETTLFDVREMDLPMFDPDREGPVPDQARELADAIYDADGMLWSSPLYHGTISGAFKNALDWLDLLEDRDPPYLTDKVIGLISTAGGVQGLQAVNTMEFTVRALRAYAVPLVIPIANAWQAFDDGQLVDEDIRSQLTDLGQEVHRASAQFATEGTCDYVKPLMSTD